MRGDCLIVEAEPVLAKNMRKYLQRHGYAARSVANADDAWREVRSRRPDIVVLDCESLGGHGVDLLAGLIGTEPRIRIVLLSYQEDGDFVLEALRLGADDLVLKPVSLERLRRVIGLLMGHNPADDAELADGTFRPRMSLVWSRSDDAA